LSDQTAVTIALIGLGGVLLAAIAGVGGAFLGSWIAAGATRKAAAIAQVEAQADRDEARRARDADRRDARLDRFADRKLSLAVDLLLAADLHSDQSRNQVAAKVERWNLQVEYGIDASNVTIPAVGPTQPVRDAFQALDLVAPGISEPARRFYQATVPLGDLAGRWMDLEREDASRWGVDWARAVDGWADARYDFVAAVRADLGVNPDGADATSVHREMSAGG
jgi:hypothetical protein